MNLVPMEQFLAEQHVMIEQRRAYGLAVSLPWFQWEGGVYGKYADGAADELLNDGASYVLRKFFFAYGIAESWKKEEASWLLAQMPTEHVEHRDERDEREHEEFLQALTTGKRPNFTPEQLHEVADACLEQAKYLIDLAREINTGKFVFPDQEKPERA